MRRECSCTGRRKRGLWPKHDPVCTFCQGRGWVVDRSLEAAIEAGKVLGGVLLAAHSDGTYAAQIMPNTEDWYGGATAQAAVIHAVREAVK